MINSTTVTVSTAVENHNILLCILQSIRLSRIRCFFLLATHASLIYAYGFLSSFAISKFALRWIFSGFLQKLLLVYINEAISLKSQRAFCCFSFPQKIVSLTKRKYEIIFLVRLVMGWLFAGSFPQVVCSNINVIKQFEWKQNIKINVCFHR